MKKKTIFTTVAAIMLLGMLAFFVFFIYMTSIAPCIPCGYITYDNKVIDGFREWGSTFCGSCEHAANPDEWIGRYMTHERALKGCPKKYTQLYNKQVKEMNSKLVEKGFEPKFEPID